MSWSLLFGSQFVYYARVAAYARTDTVSVISELFVAHHVAYVVSLFSSGIYIRSLSTPALYILNDDTMLANKRVKVYSLIRNIKSTKFLARRFDPKLDMIVNSCLDPLSWDDDAGY